MIDSDQMSCIVIEGADFTRLQRHILSGFMVSLSRVTFIVIWKQSLIFSGNEQLLKILRFNGPSSIWVGS